MFIKTENCQVSYKIISSCERVNPFEIKLPYIVEELRNFLRSQGVYLHSIKGKRSSIGKLSIGDEDQEDTFTTWVRELNDQEEDVQIFISGAVVDSTGKLREYEDILNGVRENGILKIPLSIVKRTKECLSYEETTLRAVLTISNVAFFK